MVKIQLHKVMPCKASGSVIWEIKSFLFPHFRYPREPCNFEERSKKLLILPKWPWLRTLSALHGITLCNMISPNAFLKLAWKKYNV